MLVNNYDDDVKLITQNTRHRTTCAFFLVFRPTPKQFNNNNNNNNNKVAIGQVSQLPCISVTGQYRLSKMR